MCHSNPFSRHGVHARMNIGPTTHLSVCVTSVSYSVYVGVHVKACFMGIKRVVDVFSEHYCPSPVLIPPKGTEINSFTHQ